MGCYLMFPLIIIFQPSMLRFIKPKGKSTRWRALAPVTVSAVFLHGFDAPGTFCRC